MRLYNGLINEIKGLLEKSETLVSRESKLKKSDRNSVLFLSDTAFELGGGQKPCVSSLAVSSDLEFNNNIYLLGSDLDEIKADSPFGKFVFVQIEDVDDEQKAFDVIKKLEAVRYNFSVEGFMTRASALNMREQIRVSKKAVKNGVSFADYGKMLLDEYLKMPYVKSCEIYFVTDFVDFEKLNKAADKIKQTTSALNHIFDNVMFDCSTCNLKEICDEVDGLKELHLKTAKNI